MSVKLTRHMTAFPTPPSGSPSPLAQEGFSVGSALVDPAPDAITLLLVDEHQMFTEALSRLLAGEAGLLPRRR